MTKFGMLSPSAALAVATIVLMLINANPNPAVVANDSYHIGIIESFLENHLSLMLGQRRNNENGTAEMYRDYAIADESNDDIAKSTTQQIISRSGYNYENHYVQADDGYITQLIRVVNPLADRSQLKQPPVMLMHGGLIDTTVYVWASSIQHHPEVYPRTIQDGPIRSWNRSLAFVLANNGYDVWLVGTRGSNTQNFGHIKYRHFKPTVSSHFRNQFENMFEVPKEYWQFTMDDIIQHEMPRQIDKVLQVSGARNVTMLGYSLSTQLTLSLFVSNPEYAKKVHNYICMTPIINNRGANNLFSIFHRTICKNLPDEVGTFLLTELIFTQATRDFNLAIATKSKDIRYTLFKSFLTVISGPSAKFQTLLEPAVIGHIMMPLGFKELKHYCQQVCAARLQKFDHGPLKNKAYYGNYHPPIYDISNIRIQNWIVVSAGNDQLATTASVQQVLHTAYPKPLKHIFAPNFNHLDVVAGFENDLLINLPILDYLNHFQLPPLGINTDHSNELTHFVKSQNLEQYVPPMSPTQTNFIESSRNRVHHRPLSTNQG